MQTHEDQIHCIQAASNHTWCYHSNRLQIVLRALFSTCFHLCQWSLSYRRDRRWSDSQSAEIYQITMRGTRLLEFHRSPITYVSKIHIKVLDLTRSLRYYQDMVGLKILHQTDRHATLTTDGVTPLITLEQPELVAPKRARSTGLYHFALLLPSRADLACTLQHFIDVGLSIGSSDHIV